jgi:hypothetical protein
MRLKDELKRFTAVGSRKNRFIEVKTIDTYANRDPALKKKIIIFEWLDFFFLPTTATIATLTYHYLGGRHDAIFNNSEVARVRSELSKIPWAFCKHWWRENCTVSDCADFSLVLTAKLELCKKLGVGGEGTLKEAVNVDGEFLVTSKVRIPAHWIYYSPEWTLKPLRKGPLGRLKRKWKDNSNIDFREMWYESVNWPELDRGRASDVFLWIYW